MTSRKKEDYIEVRPADSVSNARKMPKMKETPSVKHPKRHYR